MILVDLPGMYGRLREMNTSTKPFPGQRDVNLARLQMTKEYLLRADHTFIVVDIKRAASDQSLKTALLDELNKEVDFKTGSNDIRRLDATIVCTHAEVSRLSTPSNSPH